MKKGVTLSKLSIVIILLTFTHHVIGSLMTYHYAQQYEDRTILALLMRMNGYQKKHVPEGQRRTRLSSKLSKASYKGQVLKVASLLKARAHPDVRSEHYWTPLHLAAYNGSKKIVELLLNAGAHKDAQEKKGWTPLHIAVEKDHGGIVRLLLAVRAQTEIANLNGWTPLRTAAYNNSRLFLDMLLNAGANGAAQDTHKRTPLYWTVKKGHIKTVEMLLNAGAPTEGEDMFGKTILACAFTNALREPYDNRHATIINLLLLLGNASLKVDIFSWEAQKLLKDLGFDHYTFKEDREKIKMLLGEYQRLMTEDCRIPKDVTQLIISYYDGFDTRLLCFKKAKALGKFTYALTSVCKVQ